MNQICKHKVYAASYPDKAQAVYALRVRRAELDKAPWVKIIDFK